MKTRSEPALTTPFLHLLGDGELHPLLGDPTPERWDRLREVHPQLC
jgi:hypothetical protein